MDTNNPIIQLCIEGTRAEYAGSLEEAAGLYARAWDAASDDYEACIAAHYTARFQETGEDVLRWNMEALRRADSAKTAGDARVQEFYPSLYLSLGGAYEKNGDTAEASRYYGLAADLGYPHSA